VFARANGLSDDFVLGLFEDREGNIWVATTQGWIAFAIPRFNDFGRQGLSARLSFRFLRPAMEACGWARKRA